ncbi:MAG: DUF5777 family beta-barrel protein [Cyclobacteriaceae bacterium]
MRRIYIFILIAGLLSPAYGQDDLLDMLGDEPPSNEPVTSTFKSTRLINGHTIETRTQGVLEFIIGHRFGRLNEGGENLWGLDFAQIRLGLEYGVTDNLNIGIGRSGVDKTFDLFAKYKFLRQSNTVPVSAALFLSGARRADSFFENQVEGLGIPFEGKFRNAYTYQVLIARKISSALSLQVSPTIIHRNYVATSEEPNDLIALGMGGRYKITNRVTINAEYFPTFNQDSDNYKNAIAIGVDLETGGHVFQLHLTNAQRLQERGFIGETTGNFFDGDIHFGFNISRVFNVAVKENIPKG